MGTRAGVLLVNLGTPDDTGYRAVRRYLSEFLSDPRVIEANPAIWQPILQGVVLSVRPQKSGRNYARIWTHESPLRTYTRSQAEKLAARLAPNGVAVEWGMRYGNPSVSSAIDRLAAQGCDRIVLLPLYPQYSATTTATANDQAFRHLMRLRRQPAIRTVPAFPDHPAYIAALADSVRAGLDELDWTPEVVIASFHGLPFEYVQKGDPYPSECERTAAALREALGWDSNRLLLTYQSRFGPKRWLEPYTAPTVQNLAARGVKRIAVLCPGFLADCIETLDEIGNELREEFEQAGGEHFAAIPCLNDSPGCIDMLEALSRRELAGWVDPR
ncbi:ferrochelatase [Rhizosaccharibacter radicis]|uniref:Ferrochelatase n=1 Tax=Rhizosaccharibacter radicis TaxID=2782605 RepID=A0ABT1VW01_9PROT|nr:ferrochelatase [Acetobacteraceae bacterium KSS12]